MTGDFDLAPNMGNFTLWVDQKRRTFNAHIGFAIHLFFDPSTESLTKASIFIGNQVNVQAIFANKLVMLFYCIARNA